jgi:HlyD family secretion protein
MEQANLNHRQALINLAKAKTASENAARDHAKKQSLLAAGAVTQEQVDTAADAVVAAGYALTSAELSVDQAVVALSRARDDLAATDIRASYAGVVLACDLYPGDMVNKGAVLATFADISRVRLWAEIDEYDIGKVREGQVVWITADTLGKEVLTSRVERVSPAAVVANNISIFKVSTVIASGEGRLKPGMSADVAILISSDKGVVVPSSAIETIRNRSYVKVLESGEAKTKRVTAGADDGSNVAILEGLAEGERVVVSTPRPASATSTAAPASGSTIMPVTIPGMGQVGGSK